jgi:hypothetical protein
MVIDQPVLEFLTNIPASAICLPIIIWRNRQALTWSMMPTRSGGRSRNPAADDSSRAAALRDLLAREGISGFLARLGIASRIKAKKTAG